MRPTQPLLLAWLFRAISRRSTHQPRVFARTPASHVAQRLLPHMERPALLLIHVTLAAHGGSNLAWDNFKGIWWAKHEAASLWCIACGWEQQACMGSFFDAITPSELHPHRGAVAHEMAGQVSNTKSYVQLLCVCTMRSSIPSACRLCSVGHGMLMPVHITPHSHFLNPHLHHMSHLGRSHG